MSSTNSSLRRVYLFSDTYGRSKNPFDQDDADALISTDFRSFAMRDVRREFDIFGREAVIPHMVRLMFQLTDELKNARYLSTEQKKEFEDSTTGIFINSAPRTDTKGKGAPFYLAENGNVRIVTTDLSGLASVKDKIQRLSVFPNEGESLYDKDEQFRSSYTPILLEDNHNLKLEEVDIATTIPDYPEDQWELSYVDRFGNIMTYSKNPEQHWEEAVEKSKEYGGFVKLIIGNVSQRVWVTESLNAADPGSLSIYRHHDIDIVRKWEENEDRYTRLFQSAYFQYAKPRIGSKVKAR